jgi:glycosyltransferase involved in cell wall biosynthesis
LPLQWFYLPNQFWAHKNHGIVIDALNLLKKQGVHPTIVCTGTTADHRSPHYFGQIQKKIADYHLQDQFIILGLIPYAEVAALAKYSLAMINPSFFEGWSTSVEEAKSLGKRIILSHLPVHLEQAPQKAHYFDPKNAKELAEIMLQVIKIDQDKTESENGFSQENILQARKAFATNYLKIISQITRAT